MSKTPSRSHARFRVGLLGSFELYRDGKRIETESWQRSARTLLKLLVTGRRQRRLRDEVIDALWPDAPAETGASNLRYVLSLLRKYLGGGDPSPVLSNREWITLNPAHDWEIDLVQLEDLAEFDPEAAVDLYRGEPLVEERYADWAAPIRQRAERLWRDACLRLAKRRRAVGAMDAAVQVLEHGLEHDPLDEEMLRELLQVLGELDRRTEALRRFQHFQSSLQKELDVTPAAETLAMVENLRASGRRDPSQVQETTSTLSSQALETAPPGDGMTTVSWPAELTPFVGRTREIESITAMLRRPDVRLLTLTGPGGVGKTRLGVQVARCLLNYFEHGAVFVSLAPVADPELVPSAIAVAFGLNVTPDMSPLAAIAAHLRQRRLLLILDNFEHILPAALAVAHLLGASAELKVLATSREALHVYGEQAVDVEPLAWPNLHQAIDRDALQVWDATKLFVQRAQAATAGFAVSDEDAPAIAEICHRLDGLPLAIELAAARIKLFPPRALLQRLNSPLRLLTQGAKDRPSRQQTLRGAIAWSYSLLSESEKVLFARLSVFAGSWTFEAAEAVCNGDEVLDVLEEMASLVDKSLVRQEGEDEPRFSMLETIREYARERLNDHTDNETVRCRHSSYYLMLAEEAEPHLWGPDRAQLLRRLEREQNNVMEVLRWAQEREQVEIGLRLASALWPFWEARGRLGDGQRWLSRLLAQARSANGSMPSEVEIKALHAVMSLMWMQERWEEATEMAARLLERYQRQGDRWGEAYTLASLGHLALWMGHSEQATNQLEQSVALSRDVRDDLLAVFPLLGLTRVAQSTQDQHRSRRLCNQCLQLLGTRGVLESLCGLQAMMTSHVEARTTDASIGGDHLTLCRILGLYRGILDGIRNVGLAGEQAGDYAGVRLVEEGLASARLVNRPAEIGRMLQLLGAFELRRGNYLRATSLAEEQLALARSTDDVVAVAGALLSLSDLTRDQGDADQTIALAQESLALFRQIGSEMSLGFALHNLGVALGQRGEHEEAIAVLEQSLRVLAAFPHAAEVLVSLGLVARDHGDCTRAVEWSMEALRFIEGRFEAALWPVPEWNIAAALELRASLESIRGDGDRAALMLAAAEAIRARVGVPVRPVNTTRHDHDVAAIRSILGEERLAALWEAAQSMSLKQAVACALKESV